jgi:hypothetical protein
MPAPLKALAATCSRCPLRVISGIGGREQVCPLEPQKGTLTAREFANGIANEPRGTERYQGIQGEIVT